MSLLLLLQIHQLLGLGKHGHHRMSSKPSFQFVPLKAQKPPHFHIGYAALIDHFVDRVFGNPQKLSDLINIKQVGLNVGRQLLVVHSSNLIVARYRPW